MQLVRDGAQWLRAAVATPELGVVRDSFVDSELPGQRLFGPSVVAALVGSDSSLLRIARRFLGPKASPVRALLFNKNPTSNWRVGWHQDRTVAVKRRLAVPGFDVWSIKDGVHHVEPPFEIIASMLTIRLHVDDTPLNNAPLMVAPGSHQLGVVAAANASSVAERFGAVACVAAPGDAWVYATSILHMSERSQEPAQRRVLHVDFAAFALPGGLEWFGV